jgi:hypothetical protein
MNDVFEKRVRAAAVAGWRVMLIGVGFTLLQWVIYLPVLHTRPGWFLAMWGAGRGLDFRPGRLVSGDRGPQVHPLAHGIRRPLADALGATVAKAGRLTPAKPPAIGPAQKRGTQDPVAEGLFRANFAEGVDIGVPVFVVNARCHFSGAVEPRFMVEPFRTFRDTSSFRS